MKIRSIGNSRLLSGVYHSDFEIFGQMGNVHNAVDHLLNGGDAGKELSRLLRFRDRLGECLVQRISTLEDPRSHVVAGHVSVDCITDVYQSVGAQYDELAVCQENLHRKFLYL